MSIGRVPWPKTRSRAPFSASARVGGAGVRYPKRAALFSLGRRFYAHIVTAGRAALRKFSFFERPSRNEHLARAFVILGREPACVKACPTGAIMFGSKADMTNWAGERVIDLKSRGFENAGLYDPPGVGGTHVMYVLHHADRPSIYAGLPDNPRISMLVQVWKGFLKPLAIAGVALAAVSGFFHWITAGPNEVQPEDDIAAAKLIRESGGKTTGEAA